MTEIILRFPVRKAVPLACVWVRTGNPARPLTCNWVSQPCTSANPITSEIEEPEVSRVCA